MTQRHPTGSTRPLSVPEPELRQPKQCLYISRPGSVTPVGDAGRRRRAVQQHPLFGKHTYESASARALEVHLIRVTRCSPRLVSTPAATLSPSGAGHALGRCRILAVQRTAEAYGGLQRALRFSEMECS